MNLTSSDWLIMKHNIPPKLAALCDYASKVQANIDRIEYALRIGGIKNNNMIYPGTITDAIEDSRAVTLEFISIIRPYFPQPNQGEKPIVEGLLTDMKEIFKITDQERQQLRNAFDTLKYGQVLLTLQKSKELLHAYVYRTLQQAKGEYDTYDKQIMDLFLQSSVAKLPYVEPHIINWPRLRRQLPKELSKVCQLADHLQHKITVKRDYSYIGYDMEIFDAATQVANEYINIIQNHNPEYVSVVTQMLQNTFLKQDVRELSATLLYTQLYATIMAAQNKYESKFLQAVISASQERRGVVPAAEKEKGILKLDDIK